MGEICFVGRRMATGGLSNPYMYELFGQRSHASISIAVTGRAGHSAKTATSRATTIARGMGKGVILAIPFF